MAGKSLLFRSGKSHGVLRISLSRSGETIFTNYVHNEPALISEDFANFSFEDSDLWFTTLVDHSNTMLCYVEALYNFIDNFVILLLIPIKCVARNSYIC